MGKPIFLDRDGVLNERVATYVSSPEDLRLFPWTIEALAKLHEAGFDLYVVSNQQGVAKGMTSPEQLSVVTEVLQSQLRDRGFEIRKFYYCTALDSENHPWLKPAPGMVFAARNEFGLDLDGTFLIGDNWSDIECAVRAGCRPLLVLSGGIDGDWRTWEHQPERVFDDLLGAVEWIVAQN